MTPYRAVRFGISTKILKIRFSNHRIPDPGLCIGAADKTIGKHRCRHRINISQRFNLAHLTVFHYCIEQAIMGRIGNYTVVILGKYIKCRKR